MKLKLGGKYLIGLPLRISEILVGVYKIMFCSLAIDITRLIISAFVIGIVLSFLDFLDSDTNSDSHNSKKTLTLGKKSADTRCIKHFINSRCIDLILFPKVKGKN